MLPATPSRISPALNALIVAVLSESGKLGRGLHPLIAAEIARLIAKVNSYYTNAMEGNPSKLKDIDAALRGTLSADPAARNFQLEHVAHIEVQEAMLKRLREESELKICSAEFLRWLHAEFFARLPAECRLAKTESGALVPVNPGELRDRGVTVGRHEGPERRSEIEAHLRTFEQLLSPERLSGPQMVLGLACAHHRFLWIHPFPEGNGRVARLLTTAYGFKIGVGETMLWTVARAFARDRAEYDEHLAQADMPRRNDLDGRGPLSEETLVAFCEYFLRCCLDQIRYMARMLELEALSGRYRAYLGQLTAQKRLSRNGAEVMGALLSRGELPRGEIRTICGVKKRRMSQISSELVEHSLARSETPYGPLRLNVSAEMAAALFPALA